MSHHALAQRLAQLTLELVSIPSETCHEAALADYLLERVPQLCPSARIHRLRDSVLVIPPLPPGLPVVGLFGHTDTVRCATDQPVGIQEDRVFGCGASDMKAGLAVMLELLAQLPGPGGWPTQGLAPVYVFYDREEGPMLDSGMIDVLASGLLPPLELGICLEPTDNRVQLGCMGGLHARAEVLGVRAHSARPWQGDNAITRAIPLLTRLGAFGRKEVQVQGLPFYEVVNATQASTVNSKNVLPDRLVLNLNYRFAPGKTVRQAGEELAQLVRGPQPELEFPHGLVLEVEDEAPAGAVCLDHPRLQAWLRQTGLPVEAKQAWTDVARLTEAGVDAFNYGPGDTAQAHQARESASIPAMAECFQRLERLLRGGA